MVAESLKGRVLESALIIVQFGGLKKQVGPDLQGMLPRVLGACPILNCFLILQQEKIKVQAWCVLNQGVK